ncbi:MAG: aryl-sulfate sulfotransferase [Candidatus Thermoplasmatota archaeon]|nr:aryl-sulfate sulfotransferase [Candidatus Thermoplasmatota archaeon]
MKNTVVYRIVILSIVFLLSGICFAPGSIPQRFKLDNWQSQMMLDGQILFAPMNSFTTYLIDKNGEINHTWSSSYLPGEAVYWLNDGTILRTAKIAPTGSGAGGGIQKIAWDGTVVWDYRYYTSQVLSHHDIEPLPNGNILLIAWETKTQYEAIAAGRNPNLVGTIFKPDHIIEVKPTGPTSGDIVWEWHAWDHLIQDYDSSKENFGIVADHPELIDINYGTSPEDWLHCNSIDYNEEFDQILISSKYFHEIWVIDHSTTTAEAAGHTGGQSGKGGDILYRWGNPVTYRAGTPSDEKLFSQHDARWIDPGCSGEGNILIFNNGKNRPVTKYSSVDEIIPPIDENGSYYRAANAAYGPENPIWSYTTTPLTNFYADFLSSAQRLPNGNTLICNGPAGRFFEVTPQKETVWEYVNEYPAPLLNNVFKIDYVPLVEPPEPKIPDLDCTGSLSWSKVKPGETVTGSFQLQNIGGADSLLNWTLNGSSITWGIWSFTPDSGENLRPEDGPITIEVTVIAPNEKKSKFEGYLHVENRQNSSDFDVVPILLNTPLSFTAFRWTIFHQLIVHFLQRHERIENLWSYFFTSTQA